MLLLLNIDGGSGDVECEGIMMMIDDEEGMENDVDVDERKEGMVVDGECKDVVGSAG